MHDPEKDQTALLRWLRHNAGAAWFRTLALALVALPIAGVIWYNLFGGLRSGSNQAWIEMIDAPAQVENELTERKTSASGEELQIEAWDRIGAQYGEIAAKHPATGVAPWAALRAGGEFFNAGVLSLPRDKDAAQSALEKAAKQYQVALESAPKGSYLSRLAQLGYARSLEAQKDLDGATKAYKALAESAPDSAEGKLADTLIKRLERPESKKFYDDLYAFKPAAPPSLDNIPPIGPGAPGEPVQVPPPPTSSEAPKADEPAAPAAKAEEPAKAEADKPADAPAAPQAEPEKKSEAPAEPEAAKPAPAPAEAPAAPKEAEPEKKAEEPAKPAAEGEGGLPADPFAPEPK